MNFKNKTDEVKYKYTKTISNIKIGGFLIFILLELFVVFHYAKEFGFIKPTPKSNRVVMYNFNKQITTTVVNKSMDELDKLIEDKTVTGILFVMNSPGGSPAASEEFSEYLKYAQTKKPIYMYVEEIAASGGYYIASAIKPLNTNPNAIIGSIGVILPHFNLGKLADKLGIEEDNFSFGKYKEPISFFKKLNEDDKEYLKNHMLEPMYNNFLNVVSKNREIDISKIKKLAEGKIFLGNDPRIKGVLIDNVSSLVSYKNKIRKETNATIEIYKEEKSFMDTAFKTELSLNLDNIKNIIGR